MTPFGEKEFASQTFMWRPEILLQFSLSSFLDTRTSWDLIEGKNIIGITDLTSQGGYENHGGIGAHTILNKYVAWTI